MPKNQNLCWIAIRDVYTFLYLGADPNEQKVGQNLKIDLKLQIPYMHTHDQLSATVDYGMVIKRVQSFIASLGPVNLVEYLAEQVVSLIQTEFPQIWAVELTMQKAFVPISHFTGSVGITVSKVFRTD